ncbi:MAG: hypothetical protein ABFD79_06470 [Phycisphaerales bacterium]
MDYLAKRLQKICLICVALLSINIIAVQETVNASTDVSNNILKGYEGQVAPIMDLDHDMFCYFHNRELLKQKIQLIANCGFKRFYIIASPPGNPDYSTRIAPQDGPPNFLRQSREAIGDDPLAVAISFAKAAGMEVFVQYKPYEGGGTFTVPHGFVPPCNRNWIETLGGRAVGVDPFTLEHPEMLEQRKNTDDALSFAADRIEMAFVLDRIPGRESLEVTQGAMKEVILPDYPALSENAIIDYPATNFNLYISTDNGKYTKYQDKFTVIERIERRLIRNANGELAFPLPVLCRIIQLSGLNLRSPYFAIEFEGDNKAFRTIPYSNSCMSVYSKDRELPVTVSPRIRDGILTGKTGFMENGFEFEENGPYYWHCGWRTDRLYGFARGKAKHVRGSLCEGYPEVRAHWLAQIKRYIELGCDGVDIRLQNHTSGVTDFVNYGFNPPIVKAYKKRYGIDITKQDPDPIKMMLLRGDFLMMFVKDAADLLHQKGLKLQMHLDDYVQYPTLDPTFPSAGFWCMPKAIPDWRQVVKTADEISIKEYNWGKYNPYMSAKIKDEAYAAGKPLWVHCYMQQGHDLNSEFLRAVGSDKRVTGLLLYEVVYSDGIISDGMVDITSDGTVRLVPGSPIDRFLVHSPKPINRQ